MKRFIIALIPLLICLPALIFAGSFNVVPIKIFFDTSRKIENLKITNETDRKATFQIRAFTWTQDEKGSDRNELTDELIFYPKIFTLEKGEERLIKVSFASKPSGMEKTYRLFLEEIPQDARSDTNQLKIALRLGVPVFLAPIQKAREAGVIERMSVKAGTFSFQLRNKGNVHLFVKNILIQGIDDKGAVIFTDRKTGWYLLADRTKLYVSDIPDAGCSSLKKITVEIDTNTFSLNDSFRVEQAMCKG